MCTPIGRECYDSVNKDDIKCVTPCQGIFADVDKDKNTKLTDDNEVMKQVLEEYEIYKNGFNNSWQYEQEIPGTVYKGNSLRE